ncbi:MAG: Tellurite resistance protein TerB [SAR202 cluster bacterium]|nr:Tellurite resistance protein TerB [SAR202 cluster bacterium]
MGLFNRAGDNHGDDVLTFDQRQAFAAMAILAVASDAHIADHEVTHIVGNLARKRLFRGDDVNEIGRLLNGVSRLVHRHGATAAVEAARRALAPDLREAAYAVAADLLLANGTLQDTERRFLGDLRHALGVSAELAGKIAEVLTIKNRG